MLFRARVEMTYRCAALVSDPGKPPSLGRSPMEFGSDPPAEHPVTAQEKTALEPKLRGQRKVRGGINFARVNCAALAVLPSLLARWLPGGNMAGREYLARNPKRHDRQFGSFKINLATGRWADFAVEGARGGDVVSLAAYLAGIGQVEAAERLAGMLGIEARDAR
jgi:hypothetical protein